jgi:hypothetical protein
MQELVRNLSQVKDATKAPQKIKALKKTWDPENRT